MNDFDEVIDPKTGAKVLKLKADVARRAGMTGLLDAQFETYVDAKTGKQAIRVKQGGDAGGNGIWQSIVDPFLSDPFRCEIRNCHGWIGQTSPSNGPRNSQDQWVNRSEITMLDHWRFLCAVEVTNSDVNVNDFEEVTDAKTGKKILRMKKEVAKRKGFVDMDNVDFEVVIDQKTGQQTIKIKGDAGKAGKGKVSFEMVVDPLTGQQVLRMKQEVEMQCQCDRREEVHVLQFCFI